MMMVLVGVVDEEKIMEVRVINLQVVSLVQIPEIIHTEVTAETAAFHLAEVVEGAAVVTGKIGTLTEITT
jgi:hypothetical protein